MLYHSPNSSVTLVFDRLREINHPEFVGNKAKGESQNWCFKKAKHAKISEKQVFLTDELHIDIILGDFNLNMFHDSNDALKKILSSYELVINEATHISGSLIDHVYINKSLLQKMHLVNVIACDISFFDHDAVKFKI